MGCSYLLYQYLYQKHEKSSITCHIGQHFECNLAVFAKKRKEINMIVLNLLQHILLHQVKMNFPNSSDTYHSFFKDGSRFQDLDSARSRFFSHHHFFFFFFCLLTSVTDGSERCFLYNVSDRCNYITDVCLVAPRRFRKYSLNLAR